MSTDKNTVTIGAGERILTIGETATQAYMILNGSVRVFLDNDGKVVDLATLGPNQIFGEKALMEGGECSANIEAIEETKLRVFTPECLEDIIKTCDPVIQSLVPMLIDRLTQTNKKLLESETREFIDIDFM